MEKQLHSNGNFTPNFVHECYWLNNTNAQNLEQNLEWDGIENFKVSNKTLFQVQKYHRFYFY